MGSCGLQVGTSVVGSAGSVVVYPLKEAKYTAGFIRLSLGDTIMHPFK